MIKAFLIIKAGGRRGYLAFLSVKMSAGSTNSASVRIIVNEFEVQPKFCPKEGMQSNRLKNRMFNIDPG